MTDYPGLDREGTEFIIDQGCVNFGVDSASPDMWYDKTYPCHSVCAERQITTHREPLQPGSARWETVHVHRPAIEDTGRNRFAFASGGDSGGLMLRPRSSRPCCLI